MSYILLLINIFAVYYYNIYWALLITGAFMLATFLQECGCKYYFTSILGGIIFAVSIGEGELIYLSAMIPVLIFDFLTSWYEQYKEEQDYIWEMNNGPSSMNRLKMLKGEDGKVNLGVWEGGANGHYKIGDKKYDRHMNEIKD